MHRKSETNGMGTGELEVRPTAADRGGVGWDVAVPWGEGAEPQKDSLRSAQPRTRRKSSEPHLVIRRRTVGLGHKLIGQAQVHAKLRTVMHQVIQEHFPVG